MSRFSVSVVGPGDGCLVGPLVFGPCVGPCVGPYVGLPVGPRVRMLEVGICVRANVGEVGDDVKGSPRYPGL